MYGEALGRGDPSSILALFGGTSGGPEPLSLPLDSWLASLGWFVDEVGITNGARALGESGCLGADPSALGVCWPSSLVGLLSSIIASISASSSNAGPDMHDSMLSPNTCCRQLLPGALIDRSCRGGLPGIVAISF